MFLAAPTVDDPTPPPDDPVLTLAHRGASSLAPENTLAALTLAADHGVDLVEIDVRLSRDGVPVLLHDESLVRTTNARRLYPHRAPWHVADFTHDELMRLDAGSWFSVGFANERLVTLDEAIDRASARGLGVLVEVKSPSRHPQALTEVAAVLRRQLARREGLRVVVQSFDHVAMRAFKEGLPSVPVGLLGTPPISDFARIREWADQVNPHHLMVNADYVAAVHEHSMRCFVWTVNRRRSMRRALGLDVDGVITNRPQVFGEVLAGRRLATA
jgi:glycerophosphoryl diester phosphodiesterase